MISGAVRREACGQSSRIAEPIREDLLELPNRQERTDRVVSGRSGSSASFDQRHGDGEEPRPRARQSGQQRPVGIAWGRLWVDQVADRPAGEEGDVSLHVRNRPEA